MTFICDFHLFDFISEIIYLIIFPEFFSFVYMTSKLSDISNHAKHLKGLVPCYILTLFTILKSLYQTDQPAHLEEDDFSFARKRSFRIKKSGL